MSEQHGRFPVRREVAPPSSPADVDRVLLSAYDYLIAIGERWLAEHPDDDTADAGDAPPNDPPRAVL